MVFRAIWGDGGLEANKHIYMYTLAVFYRACLVVCYVVVLYLFPHMLLLFVVFGIKSLFFVSEIILISY